MFRYTIRTVEEVITGATLDALDASGEDLTDSHVDVDASDEGTTGDLSDALAALDSQVWDSLDWDSGRVIGYPADEDVDMRTGDRTRTQVIISGSDEDVDSLRRLEDARTSTRLCHCRPGRVRAAALCPDCGRRRWDEDYAVTCEMARRQGVEHGKAAASWYFDGNTPDETYRAVLRGIEEGDPAVLDTFPAAPLSGEWADGPTPSSVLEDLAGTSAWDGVFSDEDAEEYVQAYEDGFDEASRDEIERVARFQVFTVEPCAWPGGYPVGYLMEDGEFLCSKCLGDPSNPVRLTTSGDPSDVQWTWTGEYQIFEGTSEDYGAVDCAHCGAGLVPEDPDAS